MLIEGFAYRTPTFHARYWSERLFSTRRWASLARRLLTPRSAERPVSADGGAPSYVREFPPRHTMLADLQGLLDRDTALLMAHSAGQYEYLNYTGQFGDAFPELRGHPGITVRYNGAANHVFSRPEHQAWLIEQVVTWLDATFPVVAAEPAPAGASAAVTAVPPASGSLLAARS